METPKTFKSYSNFMPNANILDSDRNKEASCYMKIYAAAYHAESTILNEKQYSLTNLVRR